MTFEEVVDQALTMLQRRGRITYCTMLFAVAILVPAILLTAGTPVALGQTTPEVKSVGADLGARTYTTYCTSCHQKNGRGVIGAFPPLAGYSPNLLSQAMGRDYLIRVLLGNWLSRAACTPGHPCALPSPILRRLSSPSQRHAAPCSAWLRGALGGTEEPCAQWGGRGGMLGRAPPAGWRQKTV